MANYKKCDVCGGLHPSEEMEEITIKLLKCKDCDLSKAPVLSPITPRPEIKSLENNIPAGGTSPLPANFKPKQVMPASIRGVDFTPPIM